MANLKDLIVQGPSRLIGDVQGTKLNVSGGINQLLIGSGTSGNNVTSGSSTIHYPAKWTFNKGIIPKDGDSYVIKIPVAGHSNGVYLSLNNGNKYYPIVQNGTSKLTTLYPVNNYIFVIFESGSTASSIYPVTGGTSTSTSNAGVFRVINCINYPSVVDNTYAKWAKYKAATVIYRYQILLQKDEINLLPINIVSNNTGTSKTLTTEDFDPFGNIFYYNSTATTSANTVLADGRTYQQTTLDLRYSFNIGTTLTANKSVYLVCSPQSNGKAKLHSSPISQTLPTTDDGLIYIYLGVSRDNYQINLILNHPVYQFKNGQLRKYVGSFGTMAYQNTGSYSSATQVNTALNGKSNTGHTHDDRYYTESEINALVGSGYTNTTITEVIENMDNAIAAAITDLNDRFDGITLKRITQADYDALVNAGTTNPLTLYIIID